MGFYVDAEDLRQHYRQAGSMDDELVEEIMLEQESYVKQRLKLSELPSGNNIVKNIVRDLTVAGAIFAAPAASTDLINKATLQRGEALRRLNELLEEGFRAGPSNKELDLEVFNPYTNPFFEPSDFFLD